MGRAGEGLDDSCGAVGDAEAREDILQVLAHGTDRYDELAGDVGVRVTGREQAQELPLPRRQRASPVTANVRPIGTVQVGSVTKLRAPLGIGPWVPFLPRRLAARLTAIAALEMIQDVVSTAHGWPWPELGFDVHAATDEHGVAVWFEDASGNVISAGKVRLLDAT